LQFGGSESAAISLTNINNQQYVGNMYFGNPKQEMTVQFDTGSSVVYVLTDKCKNCPDKMDKFIPSASTTFKATD
jgi:hypothetical protein